ncbi:MAG: HNH endonuclease signature motif containing protein [Lamprobacter sp.]|uniref:HNH endonuclease signature motif containing protein n=1 Tax=Lamprobacter sp. TaxID=3100796 RepID=UPI002B256944|nr:HNH endonuclease signature motif containing protein [Lamprobacter sp.]MEA3639934.1 HNH endonuclease signature motif containing protein [Lamprobacter sp.]
MANARGPKRASYQKKYNARPAEKERRAALERARYDRYDKQGKPRPKGIDLDHTVPVRQGGSHAKSNLKPKSAKANRGWRGDKN